MNSNQMKTFLAGNTNVMHTKTAKELKTSKIHQLQMAMDCLYKMRNEYKNTHKINTTLFHTYPTPIQSIMNNITKDCLSSRYENIVIDHSMRDAWGKSAEQLEFDIQEYEDPSTGEIHYYEDEDDITSVRKVKVTHKPTPTKTLKNSSKYEWLKQVPNKRKVDRHHFPLPSASLNKKRHT